jgi:uncharacterized protein (TIGR02246 family)
VRVGCCAFVALYVVSVAYGQSRDDIKNKQMPEFLRQLADTRKTIGELYVQWTDATRKKDIDAVVGLYADEATILPDEGRPVSGKNGIRAFYQECLASNEKLLSQKFENINSQQTGDLLIDSTNFSGVLVRDGKEVPFKGKRLVVWKREFQGTWKISRDIWNKSPMTGD